MDTKDISRIVGHLLHLALVCKGKASDSEYWLGYATGLEYSAQCLENQEGKITTNDLIKKTTIPKLLSETETGITPQDLITQAFVILANELVRLSSPPPVTGKVTKKRDKKVSGKLKRQLKGNR